MVEKQKKKKPIVAHGEMSVTDGVKKPHRYHQKPLREIRRYQKSAEREQVSRPSSSRLLSSN